MVQFSSNDERGEAKVSCPTYACRIGASAAGSATQQRVGGPSSQAVGSARAAADGGLDVASSTVLSSRGTVIDAFAPRGAEPLGAEVELSGESSGTHADSSSDRSTGSTIGRLQSSLRYQEWLEFDVPCEGVPQAASHMCRLDDVKMTCCPTSGPRIAALRETFAQYQPDLNCCPKPDPRIGALQETFARHQSDLNDLFNSMVTSLQELHRQHQQHFGKVFAQALTAGALPELPVAPEDFDAPALERLTPLQRLVSDQTEASRFGHEDFNFQNTHEHAVERVFSTSSTPLPEEIYLRRSDAKPPDLPLYQARAKRVADSIHFRVSVTIAIALSSLLLGLQSQQMLDRSMDGLVDPAVVGELDFFAIAELNICMFFTFELALRIVADGPREFVHGVDRNMNLFDLSLVLFAIIHVFVVFVAHVKILQFGRLLQLVRLVRLTRLLRVLRVIRLLPQTFKLMVSSITASCSHLLWVFLLLSLIMYSFSVVFINGVTEYFEHSLGKDPDLDLKLVENYGTVFDGLLTLFASISGGISWQEVLQPLWDVGALYGLLFVVYIYFTVFGALNVLTSLFVDSVYKLSLRSRQISVQNEKDMAAIQSQRIKSFFDEADCTKSGHLSYDQFADCLQNEECAAYFSSLGLDVSQAPELFDLLDVDNDNKLTYEEFVSGCMRLKGQARSLDVNMVLTEQRKMMHNWGKFMSYLEGELESLRRLVKKTHRGHTARREFALRGRSCST